MDGEFGKTNPKGGASTFLGLPIDGDFFFSGATYVMFGWRRGFGAKILGEIKLHSQI